MITLVINRETGTLDAYDRGGSRLFRSFSTPESAEKAMPLLDRGRKAQLMLAKYRKYLSQPAGKASVTSFVGIKKISDLPKGTVVPNPDGGKPYRVGEKRGRPPAFIVKLLKEANGE
jgi:hypothetical protein